MRDSGGKNKTIEFGVVSKLLLRKNIEILKIVK